MSKLNCTLVEKRKNLLQISVQELQNDTILPGSEGAVLGARTVDGKNCIGDTLLSKYTPKYIKLMKKEIGLHGYAKPA